jgi:hypothetical protein
MRFTTYGPRPENEEGLIKQHGRAAIYIGPVGLKELSGDDPRVALTVYYNHANRDERVGLAKQLTTYLNKFEEMKEEATKDLTVAIAVAERMNK